MVKQSKLSSEELKEFKKIHEDHQRLIFDLGLNMIAVEETESKLVELQGEKKDLLEKLHEVSYKKQVMSTKLGDKYGEKQVDLETGELK